jgi:tetratricopeptide (TPR) repeat protein
MKPVPRSPSIFPAKTAPFFFWMDVPLVFLVAVAAVSCLWTYDLYGRPRRFPREPSEFRSARDAESAKAAARQALQRDPDDISAWIDLAVAGFEQGPEFFVLGGGNLEEMGALEALEKARDLGALDDRLFYYAGVMYEAKGLHDYARADYERFLRHHPEDLEVRLRLGNLYYRIEEFDKAIHQYERVLEKKPDDPLVAMNLAMVYRDRERWPEGVRLLEKVLNRGQRLPEGGHKVLGDLYRGAGDVRRALEHYQVELTRQKEDPDLWEAMAAAYEHIEDWPQALAAWDRVADLSPKSGKARQKVRQLQRKVKRAAS